MSYAINVPRNNTSISSLPGLDIGNGFRMIKDAAGKYSPSTTEADLIVKTIIVGDSGCGKSALLWRFTDNNFTPSFISTIGVDFKTAVLDRQGKVVKLQVWDVAGQPRFESIVASFFRGVHSCLLVFALDDAESFDNVRNWVKRVHQHGSESMRFVLVGNKLDLVERNPGLRQVPSDVAHGLAQTLGCEYIETSAKDDHNVAGAFAKLAEKAVERKLESISGDANNANVLRNPHKRIQLGDNAKRGTGETDNNGGGVCAGKCVI